MALFETANKKIINPKQLGAAIRCYRKDQQLTLERVSGLSNLSMRFISELERGKQTAEIGKTLELLNKLGLEVIVRPKSISQQNKGAK